jgi:putative transcriptional regulator
MRPLLLIAAPSMQDPFFEKAVVLVWHHDEDGAIGVIVNRPLVGGTTDVQLTIGEVLVLDEGVPEGPLAHQVVNWGGPVETDSGTLVTTVPIDDEEGWRLDAGVNISRSQDVLVRALSAEAKSRLCLGYAGWGPGQLDREIADGSWLFTEPLPDLVFHENADACWERAILTLGIAPEWLLMSPAEA